MLNLNEEKTIRIRWCCESLKFGLEKFILLTYEVSERFLKVPGILETISIQP